MMQRDEQRERAGWAVYLRALAEVEPRHASRLNLAAAALEVANAKLARVEAYLGTMRYAHRDAPCTDRCTGQTINDLRAILSHEIGRVP